MGAEAGVLTNGGRAQELHWDNIQLRTGGGQPAFLVATDHTFLNQQGRQRALFPLQTSSMCHGEGDVSLTLTTD